MSGCYSYALSVPLEALRRDPTFEAHDAVFECPDCAREFQALVRGPWLPLRCPECAERVTRVFRQARASVS